ncbi:hypothetical protein Syun_014215 [Stephania yunnanensis]|uniref:Transmembrane protein n=1 Tax=Stephania yunnanensis TaxID=152371 RepID=A0AAP0JJP9_9MAGN
MKSMWSRDVIHRVADRAKRRSRTTSKPVESCCTRFCSFIFVVLLSYVYDILLGVVYYGLSDMYLD